MISMLNKMHIHDSLQFIHESLFCFDKKLETVVSSSVAESEEHYNKCGGWKSDK